MIYPKSLHLSVLSLLGSAALSNATIIGFNGLGGNNTLITSTYASNATVDAAGYTVANGATPNIALTWDANFDVHTSDFFIPLESQTVGNSTWDGVGTTVGNSRIAQLDRSYNHTITFTASAGSALVLNSFDLGNTREGTADITQWTLSLTQVSNSAIVWTQNVTLSNVDLTDVATISPNFTGLAGEAYRLTLSETTTSILGRQGLDNLSFNQVAIPEPSVALLGGLGVLGLLRRRRH